MEFDYTVSSGPFKETFNNKLVITSCKAFTVLVPGPRNTGNRRNEDPVKKIEQKMRLETRSATDAVSRKIKRGHSSFSLSDTGVIGLVKNSLLRWSSSCRT